MLRHKLARLFGAALLALTLSAVSQAETRNGFTRLFDGKTLDGWHLVGGVGPGYVVRDGVIACPSDGGGKLMTEKEYSDFIFRCDFKVSKNGNNGVGIRAPFEGDAAYNGMEIQVLDDSGPDYTNLLPGQYCGSIYRVVAAKRGAEKPAGEWNHEEIQAIGRHIKIILNGKTIVDANLNDVNDHETLLTHPGVFNPSGHIGFLGHGPAEVEFKEVWIKDLSKPEKDNTPPAGFTALFNGKNLDGWKALVKDPPTRAKMGADELAKAIAAANPEMRKHWTVQDGAIHYDGKNDSLCTVKDYQDFEMWVDWKIQPEGDSGIYLRGSPQVQIWDREIGSGGLYNNQKPGNAHDPLVKADNPPGQWNKFRILMVGDRVTVYLNNVLVTNAVQMENYWERDKPIYPSGQIELQHHNSPLEFKNIYIREIHTVPANEQK